MKKFLFIVQGEGRGHLTQAIALSEMLHRTGNAVVVSMVGVSLNNKTPDFFKNRISSPIIEFQSPALVYHPTQKSLSIKRTIINALNNIQSYYKSIIKIQAAVNQYQPDIIINFYDVLGGIHQLVSKLPFYTSKPLVCIAHQYLLLHPDFIYPKSYKKIDKILVNLNSFLTSLCSKKKIALSFREITDCEKNQFLWLLH